MILTEDDIYRASTQYRLWSYDEASLTSLRANTNALATARVKDAFRRLRSREGSTTNPDEVDCLTIEEEQQLISFYCFKAMEFADFCEFPTNIKVTALFLPPLS